MAFTISPLALPEVVCIETQVFPDNRGIFFETFKKSEFAKLGLPTDFVQENTSVSKKGVVRGMHWQNPPFAQGKLIHVLAGKLFDVAVDVRKGSPNYGKWVSCEISAENKRLLWVPPGFAHGFMALEDNTIMVYKNTAEYNKESEGGFIWNDPAIGILWPAGEVVVSEKDQVLPLLLEAKANFIF